MNIWNKVFLGIIFLTAIAVVVLASFEGKIRSTGQRYVSSLEKKIEETDGKLMKIIDGSAPAKLSPDKSPTDWSFDELRGAIHTRLYERGRAWFGCKVLGEPQKTMLPPALTQVEVQVMITGPFGTAETDVVRPDILKGIVYIFEVFEKEDGGTISDVIAPGKFLGRFSVDPTIRPSKFRDGDGNEKNGFLVTLITVDPINDGEIEQIFDASKSTWAIYMTPPVDRATGIFDKLTEEEKQMFPEELREKLQPRPMPELTDEDKENVPPDVIKLWETYRNQWDDPESESTRDFSAALDWLYQLRSTILREIEIAKSDIITYKEAIEKNESENKKLTEDCVLEEERDAAMKKQRDAVKNLLQQYETEIDRINMQIEKLQTLSEVYTKKIEEYQLKVVEKIEKESREQNTAQ